VRTIFHIADLHFGSEDPRLVQGLVDEITEVHPTLVAVSGELTQRARRREFIAARAFLDSLPVPAIAVPGNHDIPLYNLYRRFFSPVRKFQRHVSPDMAPLYADGEVAVLGINTARSNVLKAGRVSYRQIELMRQRLCLIAPNVLKVLVVHHPFIPHPDEPEARLVRRGRQLLEVAQECGLDLILAGHTHLGYGDDVRARYPEIERSILVFQAGTAAALRLRGGESNAYNRIMRDGAGLRLDVRAWAGTRFASELTRDYRREEHEWLVGASPPTSAVAG